MSRPQDSIFPTNFLSHGSHTSAWSLSITMPFQPKLQTGPVSSQFSITSSPTLSHPEFDFEKKYEDSEKSIGSLRSSPSSLLSLNTKPWPERPQELDKGRREEWRSWELVVNGVMLMLPLPFFVLIAAAIVVNGNAVTEEKSRYLNFAIKAVSNPTQTE